jgi:hypothetical protein
MIPFVLFVALLSAPVEKPPLKGTLCLQGSKEPCKATVGATVEVETSDHERDYVWTSDDGSRIVLVEVPANRNTVDLGPASRIPVTLTLRGSTSRGWPSDTAFQVSRDRKPRWEWSVSPKQIGRLREIGFPSGRWSLTVTAPRHLILQRFLDVRAPVALASLDLEPLPAIRGRVVKVQDQKIVPIAGARLIREDGKLVTHTTEDGSFAGELAEPLPDQILVLHPGFATTVVPLRNLEAENNLNDIKLDAGATLSLRVTRPDDALVKAVDVTLFSSATERYKPTRVATAELPADASELSFTDLATGPYLVFIEGSAPQEYLTEPVDVRDPETHIDVTIEPYHLTGTARFGGETTGEGYLEITDLLKASDLTVDADGHFEATMWQHGTLQGYLKSAALGSGISVESPPLGADPSRWDINLRRRVIQGQVVDSVTKMPLPDVGLDISFIGEGSFSQIFNLESDGHFIVPAVADGKYDLRFTAEDRMPLTKSFELKTESDSQTVRVELGSGVESAIDFAWPDGRPVADAEIVEGLAPDGYNPLYFDSTDGAGRMLLRSAAGVHHTLCVIPREGSFAIVQYDSPRSGGSSSKRFIIPRPVASLALTFIDDEGNPTPAGPVVRFNGEVLPSILLNRIPIERASVGTLRLIRLPAGTYEVWGVRYASTAAVSASDIPAATPERIGVTAGEQSRVVRVIRVP